MRRPEAIAYYKKAEDLRPDIASIHGSLGNALLDVEKAEEAIPQYEMALQLDPSDGLLMNNLAWTLATFPRASARNGVRAVELALRAAEMIGSQDPTVIVTLAAAYAEAGRFKEAIAAEEQVYSVAKSWGMRKLQGGIPSYWKPIARESHIGKALLPPNSFISPRP